MSLARPPGGFDVPAVGKGRLEASRSTLRRRRGRARATSHRRGAARVGSPPSRSFYWGDSGFGDYAQFLVGKPAGRGARAVRTILFTDIVESTAATITIGDDRWEERLRHLDSFVALEITRFGGEVVKHTGDGHLAVFPAPGAAILAAMAIMRSRAHSRRHRPSWYPYRGEVEERADGDIGGIAVNVASRITSLANAQQLLVSRTVADLIAGGDFRVSHITAATS
jgi:class 3 adenylate cyclase